MRLMLWLHWRLRIQRQLPKLDTWYVGHDCIERETRMDDKHFVLIQVHDDQNPDVEADMRLPLATLMSFGEGQWLAIKQYVVACADVLERMSVEQHWKVPTPGSVDFSLMATPDEQGGITRIRLVSLNLNWSNPDFEDGIDLPFPMDEGRMREAIGVFAVI